MFFDRISSKASTRRGTGGVRGGAGWAALLAVLSFPLVAQTVADPVQPPSARPEVIEPSSGPTVVQIVAPNPAGVSKNLFSQLGVGSAGMVLNNGQSPTKTVLAGEVEPNPALTGQEAELIILEVRDPRPIHLSGLIEVAGPMTDVVVINPGGVICDGGGIVNAYRGTFSTGLPTFRMPGELDTLQVQAGRIEIRGRGLAAFPRHQMDLIAAQILVSAPLQRCRTLNLIGGVREVDFELLDDPKSKCGGGAGGK